VNLSLLSTQGFEANFFPNDTASADREKLTSLGASAGDGVFVLGFPMGLTGEQRNYVIVREGIIARLTEMTDKASSKFMIDSFVFPGNSGGPVVLKPDITSENSGLAEVIPMNFVDETIKSWQTKRPNRPALAQ
jgi:hypothetical protein